MNRRNFFSELKRRNVLRAGAFYAASTWLLVQVATQVFPFFHIAEWVVRWIVVASIIGFPFAMLFSWVYEWTPQGLQRESAIPTNESITRRTGKKLDRWITVILALAVVLLLADRFVLHKDAETGRRAGRAREINRGPALRQSERGQRKCLFRGGNTGRNSDPAGQGSGFESDLAHLDAAL